MRRFLTGSILLGWIAFLAGALLRGTGIGEQGLLYEMQLILVDSPAFSLTADLARGILTGVIVLTLTAALWALMFALATGEEERRERITTLGAAFSVVLVVCSILILVATVTGSPHVVGMLFSIQMATLFSLLAAVAVEMAWELGLAGSPSEVAETEAGQQRAALSMASLRLSAFGSPANDQGAN
jgi:cytochrome bd-type quinol oxidase subunit 2